ncbi:HEAT repeat domain-containing protein [Desertihabitans brevis]|uniref:HEAT repeat domain-containing protein n=1 Tax=Desertihabitans brevis TaxID=2268447 RepID=A0A367YTT8_9ACTN|nr:HEAT repeat domain-containing protein [Desertihabitans brevis]RCK69264.1 HEAT repeat domain-containing protein [Desertihabitans brevis]
MTQQEGRATRVRAALEVPDATARLQAAMAAGTRPEPEDVEVLVERSAVEPDFFVRDMLTWALTRHPAEATVDRLLAELGSVFPQARSQALHTLSKIGDRRAYPAITLDLLHDTEDEVARTAWRAAATLVPEGQEAALAEVLITQLGRGDRRVHRSLSRALAALGEASAPVLERAATDPDPDVRAHALATQQLVRDPDVDFDDAVAEAQRVVALRGAPLQDD